MNKPVFFKILIFSISFILIDQFCGIVFGILINYSHHGIYGKINYLDNSDSEILVLGSSRAEHHYNSNIIASNLKMSCYNAGIGGQSIYYSYLIGKNLVTTGRVKLIILDVSPNIFADPMSEEKLKLLLPFHKIFPELYDIIALQDKFIDIKSKSNLYIYNSSLVNIIKGIFDINDNLYYGFQPLDSGTDSLIIKVSKYTFYKKYSKYKISYFEKLIRLFSENNIAVCVIVSPMFKIDYNVKTDLKIFLDICNKYYIKFYDFSNNPAFIGKRQLFKDQLHLNAKGAKIFSIKLSKLLKSKIL